MISYTRSQLLWNWFRYTPKFNYSNLILMWLSKQKKCEIHSSGWFKSADLKKDLPGAYLKRRDGHDINLRQIFFTSLLGMGGIFLTKSPCVTEFFPPKWLSLCSSDVNWVRNTYYDESRMRPTSDSMDRTECVSRFKVEELSILYPHC